MDWKDCRINQRLNNLKAPDDDVEAIGFPERTVESIIKKLLSMKRIMRLGEGKATRYKLIVDKDFVSKEEITRTEE